MAEFTNIYDRPAQPYQQGDYWKRSLTNPKQKGNVIFSASEIAHITEFINYKSVQSGICDTRKSEYVCVLRMFKGFYKGELSAITQADLFRAVTDLNNAPQYTKNTKNNLVTMIKTFYKYLIKKGYSQGITNEDIDDIKPMAVPAAVKKPEDLPTKAQIHAITSDPNCTVMFAALINIVYYTGGRIAEILSLNWNDIIFENQFVKVTIRDTKDNKIRYVPCVQALPYLAAWRRQYPVSVVGGPEGNNPVFITFTNKHEYRRLQYPNARLIWCRLQDRSNIHPKTGKRYFGFHTLRAAHITNLAAANVPDAVIRDIAWGNQQTQMMSHYCLLSDKTKESLILQSAGIKTDDEPIIENAIRLCSKCNAPNGPRDRYCRFCGEPLNPSSSNIQTILSEASHSGKQNDLVAALARELGISEEALRDSLKKSI